MHTYNYPRPMLTVDAAVFREICGEKQILLIKRGKPPFEGSWALPGGFVEIEEDLVDAAKRELREETGISGIELIQVAAFGKPGRDPRGRNISVAFKGTVSSELQDPLAGDDAAEARWFPLNALPPLAFDHKDIIDAATG